ncbi:ABC transporter substrate-binding subunit SaoX [Cetobacterium sp. SF1]|uniref:ABC transporter substrate-binding subunit SaoX n=1 Tax=Cetobacterium sp. SF1 TaxID=3417654 RepID=UPI003CEB0EED
MLLGRRLKGIILGVSLVSALAMGKDKINLGYYNCDHMTAAPVAQYTGIFDQLGLDVNVSGNGNVPQAMIAGRMDAGYVGINNVFRSVHKGVPLVIGANNHKGGSYYLVVRNDIKDPKDLIGKKLAIGTHPEDNTGWTQMAAALGIPREGKNYQTIDIGSGIDAVMALKRGMIDGFTECDPWASYAEFIGAGKIMGTEKKLLNDKWGICCAFTLNKKFVEEKPELAAKLIQAHGMAIEYIYLHPLKSAKIFAKAYKIPEEVAIMTIYKKTVGEGRTLTWDLNPQEIQNELDFVHEYKFVPEDVTYEKVTNEEIYKKANLKDFNKFIKENIDPVFPEGMAYDQWLQKAKEVDGEK